MKLDMQIILKNGESINGKTYTDDFEAFSKELVSDSKDLKCFNVEKGENHAVILNMSDVSSIIVNETKADDKIESTADDDMKDANM